MTGQPAPVGTRPDHRPTADLARLLQVARTLDPGAVLVRAANESAPTIHGITLATSRVEPGDLFAALPGTRVHGARYAADAVRAGAVAILTDAEGADLLDQQVPVLVVHEVRAVLGEIAAELHHHPAQSLRTIGVTGTQGKTTTTRLLESALEAAGVPAAVIGTVGTRVNGQEVATALTTPEAPDLQGLFATMREHQVRVCAMEVSSHALVLGRVDGVRFDVATFLNLGRDHLDFHPDVESYYRAKAELFTPRRSRRALVNLDDEHGRRLLGELRDRGQDVRTFSMDGAADWQARDIVLTAHGSEFVLHAPDGSQWPVTVPLVGRYNVSNALAALASAGEVGLPLDVVSAHFGTLGGVPGRMESVDAGQEFAVVVDYAHKPDAVEAACATLRQVATGRLIVVLGAGGDRDRTKREAMGEIAARWADVVLVTDDNPRTEDPVAIRAAVLAGAHRAASPSQRVEVLEIGDRRLAIRAAVQRAAAGDIVLIAGKGHETGQEIDGVKHPFDDREVAAEEVRTR